MEYRDKLAVVTGAGSGIGRALALDLAGRGARLAISDVNTDTLADTVSACERLGAKVHSRRLDVANREEFLSYADDVVIADASPAEVEARPDLSAPTLIERILIIVKSRLLRPTRGAR